MSRTASATAQRSLLMTLNVKDLTLCGRHKLIHVIDFELLHRIKAIPRLQVSSL